jgi:hypothetical protein
VRIQWLAAKSHTPLIKPQAAISCLADGARTFSACGTPAASAAPTSVMFYPAYNQTVNRNSMA